MAKEKRPEYERERERGGGGGGTEGETDRERLIKLYLSPKDKYRPNSKIHVKTLLKF